MATADLARLWENGTPQVQAFITQQAEQRKADLMPAAIVNCLHGGPVTGYGPGVTIQAVYVVDGSILISGEEVWADCDLILSNGKHRKVKFHAIGNGFEWFGKGWD